MSEIDESIPYPIDLNHYNLIELNHKIRLWIPMKEVKPVIISDILLQEEIFIYTNNACALSYIIESLSIDEDISVEIIFQEIIEKISFKSKQNRINVIFMDKNFSKTFYFENEFNKKILSRYIKAKKDGNQFVAISQLDLYNENSYIPIEKKIINNNVLEKYYYYNLDNNEFYFSFNIKEDLPFEINKNEDYITKDYLIPNIKNTRSKIYRPSFVEYKNNVLIDFKYEIENEDFTEKAKEVLNFLNIVNPDTHDFSYYEIGYFIDQLDID